MQVRDVVLVHVIPQLLRFDDLVALPSDELVPTLLDGQKLRPSLAGATSGSNAGKAGSGSIGLIASDLNACAPNSTIHTIKDMLLPDDFELPEDFEEIDPGTSNSTTVAGRGLADDPEGGLSTGVIAAIATAAAVLLLLAAIAVLLVSGSRRKHRKAKEARRAATANGERAGLPPGHPMYNQTGSHFDSMSSGPRLPSGFESQWGSFVPAGSGHPPYPGGHPGALYCNPHHGSEYVPSQVSAMGCGTGKDTHSSVGSDGGRRSLNLGVQSFRTDTYHERNITRGSENNTYGSSGTGSAVGAHLTFAVLL